LRDLPRTHETLVFPALNKDNPISGWSKWKRQLDEISGVSAWRHHDLRRTTATELAKLKVAPHVIERILHHKTGILGGVAGIYNQYGYQDEMRSALTLWSDKLQEYLKQ